MDQILLDYDDNSQVVTYDHATGDKNVYMGVEVNYRAHYMLYYATVFKDVR